MSGLAISERFVLGLREVNWQMSLLSGSSMGRDLASEILSGTPLFRKPFVLKKGVLIREVPSYQELCGLKLCFRES